MPRLVIDGREVRVPEGATVLDAADELGIDIPTLCFHPELEPSTSCMLCVVRVDGREALVPSCATVATEGMVVESECEAVLAARRTALELLLSEHAGDCVAPCQRADDRHVDVPHVLRLVGDGDFGGAAACLESSGVDLEHLEAGSFERAEKACRRGRFDQRVAIDEVMRLVASRRATESGRATAAAPPYREFTVKSGALSREELRALVAGASADARVAPSDPTAGLTPEEAVREAQRCVHCDCREARTCALRAAGEALGLTRGGTLKGTRPPMVQDHSHPDVIHEPGKCVLCGLCLQVAARAGERLGLAFVGRGHDLRVRAPFDEAIAEALSISGVACADVCPTGALVRKRPR